MNYVYLNIETTGFNYKKDELILIECIKFDENLKKLDKLKIHIKPKRKIPKYISNLTKIADEELENGIKLNEALLKLKDFLKSCYVICFNGKFDLSFLITAMYHTKIDMNFWYLDLKTMFEEKLHYSSIKKLFEYYNINFNIDFNKYIELTKKYMEDNNISNLKELVKIRPNKYNMLFRGINYPESLGDSGKYSFYIADLTKSRYPSYLATLKEIRKEEFTFEELKNLKDNYDVKILLHILKIDEVIIKITNDYYIISHYDEKISLKTKWGRDYIEELNNAVNFIKTHNDKVEITCYGTIKELEETTKYIDKKLIDVIKTKIVREKNKWSRWE